MLPDRRAWLFRTVIARKRDAATGRRQRERVKFYPASDGQILTAQFSFFLHSPISEVHAVIKRFKQVAVIVSPDVNDQNRLQPAIMAVNERVQDAGEKLQVRKKALFCTRCSRTRVSRVYPHLAELLELGEQF